MYSPPHLSHLDSKEDERPKASPMSQSWWQSQGFMEHDGGVGWERSVSSEALRILL